jgi:hypothetical protein
MINWVKKYFQGNRERNFGFLILFLVFLIIIFVFQFSKTITGYSITASDENLSVFRLVLFFVFLAILVYFFVFYKRKIEKNFVN